MCDCNCDCEQFHGFHVTPHALFTPLAGGEIIFPLYPAALALVLLILSVSSIPGERLPSRQNNHRERALYRAHFESARARAPIAPR